MNATGTFRRGRRLALASLLWTAALAAVAAFPAYAGNLVLTGHDMELHCSGGAGCNNFGVVVNFVRQGAPTKTLPILVLDSGTETATALGMAATMSHNGVEGAGNAFPFTVVDPSSAAFATTPLSVSNWSAIIIASDSTCGGCDNTVADITAINARTSEIQAFFSAGGGLLYLAGADNRATYYASVPIPATGLAVAPPFTVTSAGLSLGLNMTESNCCATHNSFSLPAAGSPLQVAETDSAGNAETLFASGAAICSGTLCGGGGSGPPVVQVPTLSQWALMAMVALLFASGWVQLRRRRRD